MRMIKAAYTKMFQILYITDNIFGPANSHTSWQLPVHLWEVCSEKRSDYDQELSIYYQGHPTHRETEPHTDRYIDDLYRPLQRQKHSSLAVEELARLCLWTGSLSSQPVGPRSVWRLGHIPWANTLINVWREPLSRRPTSAVCPQLCLPISASLVPWSPRTPTHPISPQSHLWGQT